jgi:hypothetical protein
MEKQAELVEIRSDSVFRAAYVAGGMFSGGMAFVKYCWNVESWGEGLFGLVMVLVNAAGSWVTAGALLAEYLTAILKAVD